MRDEGAIHDGIDRPIALLVGFFLLAGQPSRLLPTGSATVEVGPWLPPLGIVSHLAAYKSNRVPVGTILRPTGDLMPRVLRTNANSNTVSLGFGRQAKYEVSTTTVLSQRNDSRRTADHAAARRA